jgi:hypothetical protein
VIEVTGAAAKYAGCFAEFTVVSFNWQLVAGVCGMAPT